MPYLTISTYFLGSTHPICPQKESKFPYNCCCYRRCSNFSELEITTIQFTHDETNLLSITRIIQLRVPIEALKASIFQKVMNKPPTTLVYWPFTSTPTSPSTLNLNNFFDLQSFIKKYHPIPPAVITPLTK